MKKTLAAVLAAAMALSTATVAFATDFEVDAGFVQSGVDDEKTEILYGKDVKLRITELTFDDGTVISGSDLSQAIDDNEITLTPIVTEGSNKLSAKPSVTTGTYKTGTTSVNRTAKFTWNGGAVKLTVNGKTREYKDGDNVTSIPVDANGNATANPDDVAKFVTVAYYMEHGDPTTTTVLNKVADDMTTVDDRDSAVQVKFKVTDTYGTGDTTIGMKFRVNFKKKDVSLGGSTYKKGDTLTSEELKFKAVYKELNSYYKDMQLTLDEVDARNVKFDASDLYDEIGNDTFTIAFEDTAVFEAKLSASQKDLNLYYDLDEKTDVTSAYPSVDFEFITFRGNPSFVNSGSMTFNAIGGKNTTVYTFDGETLNPLTSTYDSTYGTVTVKGIKKLGTFVVASEILEVEDEEDNEPVSSAPIVEESSSQPSSNDGDRNPSTGAC